MIIFPYHAMRYNHCSWSGAINNLRINQERGRLSSEYEVRLAINFT